LIPGETWKLEDLIVFMLVSSSNDAALAISREALEYTEAVTFPEYMTNLAKELGFSSLQFMNASGLDVDEAETVPGAMGTAQDITKLFSLSYKAHKEIFDQTKKEKVTFSSDRKQHTAENTNIALHSMPGVIGSKTGYTNTAGGNLSVITEINGVPHVVTVLDSTRSGRFEDVQEIIGLTQEEYHD
jgi:D-alanyl-D-alanine carboxypeptidase (penicillin-binding protein 5/6)